MNRVNGVNTVLRSSESSLWLSCVTMLAAATLNGAIARAGSQALLQRPSDPEHRGSKNPWRATIARPPMHTTWIGAQSAGSNWALYTGTSTALTGTILSDGWRLRVTGGYGRYRYHNAGTRFVGQHGFGKVMLGYRAEFGALTLKAFAGMANAGHAVMPFDPDNAAIGTQVGGAGTLEAWYNYSDTIWASADASYSTVFDSYSATLRLGRRVLPATSLGFEFAITGNRDFAANRAAALLRHAWKKAEIRLSVGGSIDRDDGPTPYAALSISLSY